MKVLLITFHQHGPKITCAMFGESSVNCLRLVRCIFCFFQDGGKTFWMELDLARLIKTFPGIRDSSTESQDRSKNVKISC